MDKNNPNPNKRKQLALGSFFQPAPKKNSNGTVTQRIIPKVPSKKSHEEASIPCKSKNCMMKFKTSQGLGSHLNSCLYYKQDQMNTVTDNKCIVIPDNITTNTDSAGKPLNPRLRRMAATVEVDHNQVDMNIQETHQDVKIDARKKNRGSSKRSVYTSKQKWDHIEEFESWENDKLANGEDATVTAYIKEHRLGTKFKKFLSTSHPGWREPSIRNSIKTAVVDKLKSKLAVPSRANLYIAKYPIMERKLVDELKQRRARKARVSALWIRTTAKKLAVEHYPDKDFKASNGWFFRFLRRFNIKFRKRKNQKAVSAEEKRSKLQEWHKKLRYEVLPYRNGHKGSYDGMFGRFPPERRYNMDQVPIPFIVEQGNTFTHEDDEHFQVRGTRSEGLTKRQYTAHIFINAGDTQETTHGYIDMVCRGTGKRISAIEKEAYNTDKVNVFWQKKAWVDRDVMVDIAKTFVKFKKEKHGDDAVLLFADNLDAHCYAPVLEVLSEANILVWFIVPGCTDLIQPIDAGIGRSIRIYVGHALDRWLSIDDNLDEWEGKLSASDRRVMMTNFLSSAMNKMLSEEKKSVRIGAFRKTGCLIELNNRKLEEADGNIQFSDDYIKPQGLNGKYEIPSNTGHAGMGIGVEEVVVPAVQEHASSIDSIVNEEDSNDILGGDMEQEELDHLQDVVREDEGHLVPGGIDMD